MKKMSGANQVSMKKKKFKAEESLKVMVDRVIEIQSKFQDVMAATYNLQNEIDQLQAFITNHYNTQRTDIEELNREREGLNLP